MKKFFRRRQDEEGVKQPKERRMLFGVVQLDSILGWSLILTCVVLSSVVIAHSGVVALLF